MLRHRDGASKWHDCQVHAPLVAGRGELLLLRLLCLTVHLLEHALIQLPPPPFLPPHQVGLDPVSTNILLALCPLLLAVSSLVCQSLSRTVGRVPACLTFRLLGVVLLLYLGLFPSSWANLRVTLPLYVVRTAFMNATYPLRRSILMDYVSKVSPELA